jgi:hypothetical protein
MSKERARSIKSAQIQLRMLTFSIDGTAGTPAASGPDRLGIASVTDLGAGNYTIIFANPAVNAKDVMVSGHMMLTASTAMSVTAVAFDRITVQCTDLAGVAADADFSISVMVHDARFEI